MSKKRVSLTLDEELVEMVDSQSNREELNRSQMTEEILRSHFQGQKVETAVVFCGDPGAKAMKEWEEKPVLAHVLENLQEYVSKAYLLPGNNKARIESEFGKRHENLFLRYFSDDSNGNASALRQVQDEVEGTFIAANGHVITDVDIDEMLEVHREETPVATMALTTVEDPSDYGVARLKGRAIKGFEEKPRQGAPSRLINAGTYILQPEIFSHLNHETIEEVFEDLASRRQLAGYIYGGYWRDFKEE